MGKVKAKRKIPSDEPKDVETQDVLSRVLELGGQKEDVQLIDINDEGDEITMNEADELDAEPVSRDDVREFIQQLKIKQHRDPSFRNMPEDKPSKKKTQKEGTDAEERDDQVTPDDHPASSGTKKEKKKKGNKFRVQHEEISSTVDIGSDSESADLNLSEYKSRKYLLMKTGSDWIEQSFASDPTTFAPVSERTLRKARMYAQRLYDDEIALYQERKKSGKSESAWMNTVVSSGTLGDKVAALTVMIQDALVHTLQQLDQLLAMLKKKGKREAFLALDNLKEMFLTVWLPDNRKLRKFEEHPLSQLSDLSSGNRDSRDKRLIIWYYESLLKDKYAEFVDALESLAHDQLPAAKVKAVGAVHELLVAKPELEKKLLTILVNKLGDPDHKIASKCTHQLLNLLEKHPNMKGVVTLEIERLLYRPNVAQKAQYYGVCFLNQILLSQEETQLASRLISVYFTFFKSFVKKGEVDSRMMSALLSGVNRAYPYAKDDKALLEENMNTLYKVVHVVNFNTAIQALMLIYQVMDSSATISDRYYSSLYRKLLDQDLAHSSKQAMFLNLLFKTLKKDTSSKRIKAFIKRILQMSSFQSPTFACSTLILVAEVLKAHPGLLDLSHAAVDSDEEECFVDVPEEEEEEVEEKSNKKNKKNVKSKAGSSWIHRANFSGNHDDREEYDPLHRNPLYTCADKECIWELKKMARHYHPSVVLFANTILEGKSIQYPGDPLQDFSLIRFLDRFVYRNPKKRDATPKAVQAKSSRAPVGARALAVNSDEYLHQDEAKIPADEKFFFKYFSARALKKSRPEDLSDVDSEAESVEDDEFDDYLAKHEGQFEGDHEIDFDFAGEFSKNTDTKKKKGTQEEDSDEDEEDEEADDLSDEEVDLGDLDMDEDEDMDEDDEEEDDEDIGPSDEEDEEDDIFAHGKKPKSQPIAAGGRKGHKDDISNLFASAEEFSHLLEEGAGGDTGGSQAMSNVKDKAGAKQLKWEMERDRWLRDADWRQKKKPRSTSRGRNQPRQKQKGKKRRK